MTMILPVGMTIIGAAIGGPVGGASGAAMGATLGLVVGAVSAERGGGAHIKGNAKKLVQAYVNTAMAANWGIAPVLAKYTENNQAVLLDDMYNATASKQLEDILEQWAPIKAHVLRAHLSGIPPLKAMRWIKANYRDRIIGKKQRGHAVAIATTVAQCYGTAHPDPQSDYAWYERWAGAIGFKPVEARTIWDSVMATIVSEVHEEEVVAEAPPVAAQDAVIDHVPRQPRSLLDDDVVETAPEVRAEEPVPAAAPRTLWDLT